MDTGRMVTTENQPSLRGLFQEIGQLRRECGAYAIDYFTDRFLEGINALELLQASAAGYRAGGKLYHISEGLVCGAIGREELKYFDEAQPILASMLLEHDREKKTAMLYAELADTFLTEESRAYYAEYLATQGAWTETEKTYHKMKRTIGRENSARLLEKLCGVFRYMPLMQAYQQGFFESAACRLRCTDKETGMQVWREWCIRLASEG